MLDAEWLISTLRSPPIPTNSAARPATVQVGPIDIYGRDERLNCSVAMAPRSQLAVSSEIHLGGRKMDACCRVLPA